MIGDVPKGAPLRCRLGRHTGQERGGTMVFTCKRCGGDYWQPHDYSPVTRAADAALDRGDREGAQRLVRDALKKNRH